MNIPNFRENNVMAKFIFIDGVDTIMNFESSELSFRINQKNRQLGGICCYCRTELKAPHPENPGDDSRVQCPFCNRFVIYKTLVLTRNLATYFNVRGAAGELGVGGIMHIYLPESHPEFDKLIYSIDPTYKVGLSTLFSGDFVNPPPEFEQAGDFSDSYPVILSMNFLNFLLLRLKVIWSSDGRQFINTLYSDIKMVRKSNFKMKGWNFTNDNPFKRLRLNSYDGPGVSDLDKIHHHILLGNGWTRVGEWAGSEKHYGKAINLSIKTNNIDAAVMAGTNLAYCYLASEDDKSALVLSNQILEIPINFFDITTYQRLITIRQLLFLRTKNEINLKTEIYRLDEGRKFYNVDSLEPEYELSIRGKQAFHRSGQLDKEYRWKVDWDSLRRYYPKKIVTAQT